MNIRKRYIMMAAIAVMSVVSVACGTNENAVFNGSKTGDENHFDIDFEMLNAAYEHKFHLISDDEIVRLETDNNGTNVYWAYGDSEEPSAAGE